VSDDDEVMWGLDPGLADTDGDGLSDGFEVGYDGDRTSYYPYDPTTKTGTDLNATSMDTDADAMDDAWETAGSLDPLGDDRDGDQDADGYTNFVEYSRGTLPNDPDSVPAPVTLHVDDDGPSDPVPGDPSASDPAEDGTADHPFDSIQEALDSAIDGDKVIVADGVYRGDGNRDMNFMGKSVKLVAGSWASSCTIDCEQAGRAFNFRSGEDPNAIVQGFTIINGYADNGGAVYYQDSSPAFRNCIFASNTATNDGGAFLVTGASSPEVTNCTLTRNVAGARGGAICCAPGNSMVITNTIFWDNTHETAGPGREIYLEDATEPVLGSRVDLLYSCIPSAWDPVYVYRGNVWLIWWDSLVASDPQFADPDGTDYHLMSRAGRWDRDGAYWVTDDVNSPCIDAGDPDSAWVPEIWPHGKLINIGAYGGTPEASLSASLVGRPCDLSGDDFVDVEDVALFGEMWLSQKPPVSADLDQDGLVDFRDLRILAECWLSEEP
ncbi:MAG: right-handed parallel beta-helix repeat-containing protein, partial [Phycisphaerales bacterium]